MTSGSAARTVKGLRKIVRRKHIESIIGVVKDEVLNDRLDIATERSQGANNGVTEFGSS